MRLLKHTCAAFSCLPSVLTAEAASVTEQHVENLKWKVTEADFASALPH